MMGSRSNVVALLFSNGCPLAFGGGGAVRRILCRRLRHSLCRINPLTALVGHTLNRHHVSHGEELSDPKNG